MWKFRIVLLCFATVSTAIPIHNAWPAYQIDRHKNIRHGDMVTENGYSITVFQPRPEQTNLLYGNDNNDYNSDMPSIIALSDPLNAMNFDHLAPKYNEVRTNAESGNDITLSPLDLINLIRTMDSLLMASEIESRTNTINEQDYTITEATEEEQGGQNDRDARFENVSENNEFTGDDSEPVNSTESDESVQEALPNTFELIEAVSYESDNSPPSSTSSGYSDIEIGSSTDTNQEVPSNDYNYLDINNNFPFEYEYSEFGID